MERNISYKLSEYNTKLQKCARVFDQAVKYNNRTFYNYEIMMHSQLDTRQNIRYTNVS